MLQTFISQIVGAEEPGTGNVAASPSSTRAPGPQPVAGGPAGRQPREGWGCGGAALRFQRPHLAPRGTLRAQPRRCSPSSALLLLLGSLSPWVSGRRRSRGGPGSYSRPGGCWLPSLTAAGPARRATWLSAPPGYPPLSGPGRAAPRRLLSSPAARGSRRPGLMPCTGRCFLLVQGRAARVKPEAVGDLLPAFHAF